MSFDKAKRAHDRITRRYVIGLLLLATAIFGEQYIAHQLVVSERNDAYVLNISGKQRVLSQRIVSLSQQLLTGNEQFQSLLISTREQMLSELEKDVASMRSIHSTLTDGDTSIGLTMPDDERLLEIYFKDGGIHDQLTYFLSLADQVVSADDTDSQVTNAVVMMVMLSDSLLAALDSAVSMYVTIAAEKTELLRHLQVGHVLIIALLLILEIIFIFRPMARRVQSTMEDLVREKNYLNDSLQRETEIASFSENSPEPIISLDEQGRFLYANPAAEDIVRALKKGDVSFATHLGGSLRAFLQKQEPAHFSFTIGEIPYKAVAVPYTSGEFINFYFHNVKSLKEAEDKATKSQRMEAIGQLTGGVAHDFNNLLMVITGSLQLALSKLRSDGNNKEMAEKLIESALGAVDTTAGLTRNLLAFSRRQPLAPESMMVSDVISSFKPLLKNAAGGAVTLEIRENADEGSVIEADRGQFEAALLNLVINARDAMPEGGSVLIESKQLTVSSAITARYEDLSPGNYVVIAVTDNGAGIPAYIRSKIFEPFFTTKEVGAGSGLGLSMVWGFVKQSGGHVTIYSEEGIGTTVRLIFPLSESTMKSGASNAAPEVIPAGAQVLVVEDDDKLRSWIKAELEDMDHQVIATHSGEDALRIIKERDDFSIVISDIFMPDGMTGLQLCDEVRKHRGDLPVLLISGFPNGSVPMLKGQRVLSKPFSRVQLASELNRVIQEKAA